jgi:transposase
MTEEVAPARFVLQVGVDVSATKASVAWIMTTPPRESEQAFDIPLTPNGMATLCQQLLKLHPDLSAIHITLEATGNYHLHLAHFLHQQGCALSVINPIQARRFAEVFLQREKTDAMDALTLARMGTQVALKLWTPPPPLYEELQQRVVQRAALVKMHAETLNRQKSRQYRITTIPAVDERSIELRLLLKRQIEQIEKEFPVILKQDPEWAASARRIVTIPGVGISTAAWLIMLTLNFTTCESPEQLASFLGLVPHRRQSGTTLNTFVSIGHVGHDDIRHHLYVATMSCLHYNPIIRAYYDQVKARRKSHRLSCIAAERKLVHMIWAIAKGDHPFDPDYLTKSQAAKQAQK